jgi:molybdate transport system substrate-binding protein
MRRLLVLSAILLLALTTIATSAELKIFASRAIWTVLQEVGPSFERTTGHTLSVTTGLSPAFSKRIDAGEPFDLMFAPPASLDGTSKLVSSIRTRAPSW